MGLTMALVYDSWSVDHSRPDMLAKYAAIEPTRQFPDYLGHHVGALLVDPSSNIVSFALNRNVVLNSTLEHAEARTIRNAIRIANEGAGREGPKRWSFGDLLQEYRLYGTLEPCAQCAGIMDLANIGETVYGQEDPAQNHIVNVLYNLQQRPGTKRAPTPIAATFTPAWDQLAQAFEQFQAQSKPNVGVTSFLATVEAYQIYRNAAQEFSILEVRAENAAALQDARAFRTKWQERISDGIAPL